MFICRLFWSVGASTSCKPSGSFQACKGIILPISLACQKLLLFKHLARFCNTLRRTLLKHVTLLFSWNHPRQRCYISTCTSVLCSRLSFPFYSCPFITQPNRIITPKSWTTIQPEMWAVKFSRCWLARVRPKSSVQPTLAVICTAHPLR